MKQIRLAIILASATVVAFLSAPAIALADGFQFRANLSGAQKVTEPPGGVVTDTTGDFKIDFNDDLSEARFRLRVFDGVSVTDAHLHCALAGANGPVVVVLFGPDAGVDVDGVLAEGTLTNADVIARDCVVDFFGPTPSDIPVNNIASLALAAREGGQGALIYVNIHTVNNEPGEVRGQLLFSPLEKVT